MIPCLALSLLVLQTPLRDLNSDTWAATDELGRQLPGYEQCGPPRKDRYVGIFYFLWMQPGQPVYDNSKLRLENPADPQYGPVTAFHWWGKPELGYYLSDDEFVIRKHAEELSDAGVDTLIFDVTNAATYDSTFLTLCTVYEEMRGEGEKTPQFAFFTHADAAKTAQHLYDTFYSKNLYPDLWFRWKGKPLLLGPLQGLSKEISNFFTVRESWAWSDPNGWFGNGQDRWPWIDNSPQNPGWHESKDKPEEISVAVAEHPTTNIGRSYHAGHEPSDPHPADGLFFAEQWKRALKVDPEFIYVTGWNEWIAQRFLNQGGQRFLGKPLPANGTFFVDEYNEEYSRDIEPMTELGPSTLGSNTPGHGDDYYYQLVSFIRQYKGVRPLPSVSRPVSVHIGQGFGQWQQVQPTYLGHVDGAAHRDHAGYGDTVYTNGASLNDFAQMKVARDSKYVYFYAQTTKPIVLAPDQVFMTLLLDVDRNHQTGWEGYDYAINLKPGWIEKNTGGWNWSPVSKVQLAMKGNELQIAVPRAICELNGNLNFEFKWVDGVSQNGNILSFIDQGEVAPSGRFNYVYRG
ncbi:MAG TPA: hypothetical protein VGL56_19150 [Fimbriimonadaceae bacterium]|jgi:hypothetical protein